jgi:enoyl-CoA hydratase/carnithine racemase
MTSTLSLEELGKLQSGRDGKITVEFSDRMAIIRMDRGENRFNKHFIDEMNAALDTVLSRDDIQALVTTGTGKFYSNGIDLTWIQAVSEHAPSHVDIFINRWHKLMLRILTFPMLTVAAINGHAFAGGAIMSMAHDYRLMQNERGWFSINEVHLRLRLPKWTVKLLSRKIAPWKAQSDVVLFGRRLTARQARDLGVIQQLTTSQKLLHGALAIINEVIPNQVDIDRDMLRTMKEDLFADVIQLADEQANEAHTIRTGLTSKL